MSGTDYTTTPNLGLYKPTYDADEDQWGNHLNSNADTLDSVVATKNFVTSLVPQPSTAAPNMDGTASAGTNTVYARGDHTHPSDTSRLPLTGGTLSGSLTINGTLHATQPTTLDGTLTVGGQATGQTPAPGNNSTQFATTAFVQNAVTGSTAGVSSFNSRTGAVTLQQADVTGAGGALAANVPVASSTPPVMDSAAAVGTGTTWARADHVHPSDTSRYAASNPSGFQTAAQVSAAISTVTNGQDVGRNFIHNGLFTVQQRGAGPFTSGPAADRWYIGGTLDTISMSVVAANDTTRTQVGDEAARFILQNSFTGNAGAGAFNLISQAVEDVRRLAGKTVILSFYAVAGTAGLKLGVNGYQYFGTGGSPSGTTNLQTTGNSVTLAGTWARYSTTFAIPSAAGKTLGTNGDDKTVLQIFYSSGATNGASAGNIGVQSGLVQLWGMQLEIAGPGQTQPTPLEKRDPMLELALCQRFYCTFTVWVRTDASTVTFPVTMRAAPTLAGGGAGFSGTPIKTGWVGSQTAANVQNMTASADL